ncbi:MAG: DUF1365 domain-containing protein [Rhodospirillaceae bacterium]|mgnify:CR=1 FL=1|nr:DUF1365 domain-containing protein [Rhodospirillaceae bacterium]|tara:strand:- start:3721 stop:4542 length:822 start_codon:yes stop_codon:yes gene_type:complete
MNTSSAKNMGSCLYWGKIMHQRMRPTHHRFKYRVFWGLFDLDELADLDREVKGFAYNRWGLFSFQDRDHGPRDGSKLRPWIDQQLLAANIDCSGGAVRLLCFPRLFGFVFNPLSVWFCYGSDEVLRAVLYEVRNTFGESHSYLIKVSPNDTTAISSHSIKKCFHVSPFLDMACTYTFRLSSPGKSAGLHICQSDGDGKILLATMAGAYRPFNAKTLLLSLSTYPFMTFKVIAAIHWEALRLWLKRVPYFPKPLPPKQAVTTSQNNSDGTPLSA